MLFLFCQLQICQVYTCASHLFLIWCGYSKGWIIEGLYICRLCLDNISVGNPRCEITRPRFTYHLQLCFGSVTQSLANMLSCWCFILSTWFTQHFYWTRFSHSILTNNLVLFSFKCFVKHSYYSDCLNIRWIWLRFTSYLHLFHIDRLSDWSPVQLPIFH